MIKNITGKEFYELMCNIGYKEHVFFMNPEDYEEGMTKTDTINGWLGFAINTWLRGDLYGIFYITQGQIGLSRCTVRALQYL